MKYGLIKDTMKVVSIKEIGTDKVNLTITITSMKDEIYVEQYTTQDEVFNRLTSLNSGFNYGVIKNWWNSFE